MAAQRKLQEAVAAFPKAIKIDPGNATYLNNLAEALFRLDEGKESIAHYRRAVQLEPANASILVNLGFTMRQLGRFEEAVIAYRKAIELDPDSSKGHIGYFNTMAKLGKLNEAIVEYRSALEQNPNNPIIRVHLGCALANTGRHEEALTEYQKTIYLKPKYRLARQGYLKTLTNLVRRKVKEKNISEAAEYYLSALQLDFDLSFQKRILRSAREFDGVAEKIHELAPENHLIRFELSPQAEDNEPAPQEPAS